MVDPIRHTPSEMTSRSKSDGGAIGKEVASANTSPTSEVRLARIEKAVCKAEMAKAVREAKAMQRVAISADKNARAKEARAAKLAKRAELARIAATSARANAKKLYELAVAVEQGVSIKYAELKDAVQKLREAEKIAKNTQQQKTKQRAVKQQKHKQTGKGTPKRLRKINGLKTAGAGS